MFSDLRASPEVDGRSLVIAYTPMHGVGALSVERGLERAGFPQFHTEKSQRKPDPYTDQGTAEYVSNHFYAVCPQRHADSDLIRSLRHSVGSHSIESNRSQQQSHDPEQSGEAGD